MSDADSVMDDIDRDERIRSCLANLLDSEQFRRSKRLCAFIQFIVERELAGQGDQILGKTIAEEVYGRSLRGNAKDESLVRVDAGRVRRALAEYYSGPGSQDEVTIEIPLGTYRPVFHESFSPSDLNTIAGPAARRTPWLIGGVAALLTASVIVVAAVLYWPGLTADRSEPSPRDTAQRDRVIEFERQAMFEKSPKSLQAFDFAQQARGLIFPPTNPDRLALALQHFETAIELDPDFHGGYAGAAQVMAFLAFLPNVPDPEGKLSKAVEFASLARKLAPANAWVQSSLAWVAFVGGDFDRAVELSERAMALAPLDRHVIEFSGMISVFNGDFDAALNAVRPLMKSDARTTGYVHLNIYAVANYHLGNYQATIETFDDVVTIGGTSSPLTLSYMAAAQAKAGDQNEAERLVEALKQAWPQFSPVKLFTRVYRKKDHAQQVIAPLIDSGWTEPGD